MVDTDIQQGYALWDEYSHDAERMARIFSHLFNRYRHRIERFLEGLWVLQADEDSANAAIACRNNVALLLERLEGFRENDYSNDGLMQYYITKEHEEIHFDVDFTQVRMEIGMMDALSHLEQEEIMEHLDDMEEICAKVAFRREKWNLLREHLIWVSGKDVAIAMKILPLFFRIS